MKTNTVLFEGTVMDARESHVTDPPSEVIDINYPLPPIPVVDVYYEYGKLKERVVDISDKGWFQIILPVFNGLKPGDRIQVIKL